jgi:DNA-binding Xre family transcriptional regulator
MTGKTERSLQLSMAGQHKADKALLLTEGKDSLATQTGISRSTIYSFFKGNRIDRHNFVKICNALKLKWEEVAEQPEVETSASELKDQETPIQIS